MKVLGSLAALFLICIVCCCGIGAFLGPSSSTTTTSAPPASTQPKESSTPTTATTTQDSEVDRILAERSKEYETQLAAWNDAKADLTEAKSELDTTQSEIESHQATKPSPPTHAEREWSTVDKKFTTNATLIDTDNVKAKLRKTDGKEIVVPKDALIAGDRIYIDNAFNASVAFDDAMAEWNATNTDLDARLAAIKQRIESGTGPSPTAPNRSEIQAELAAAKAERDRRAQMAKAQADAKAKAAVQKRAQDEIDAYATILRVADPDGALVKKVSSKGDELILTVSNAWHFQPYQIRLQAAQNLWEGWANLHSRSEPDKARLSLVDFNGNEVGGSRVWGGSLIWVKED